MCAFLSASWTKYSNNIDTLYAKGSNALKEGVPLLASSNNTPQRAYELVGEGLSYLMMVEDKKAQNHFDSLHKERTTAMIAFFCHRFSSPGPLKDYIINQGIVSEAQYAFYINFFNENKDKWQIDLLSS